MSKLIGYYKNVFNNPQGQEIEYAKVYVSDPVKKNGAGEIATSYKATVQAVNALKPDQIGRECVCYFDQYKRVQFVSFESK